jgi:hypothetical protein
MNYLKHIFLLMLLCGLSLTTVAREMAFEQNWIQFEEGQPEIAELYFDMETDVLTVRAAEGEDQDYRADKVVSFSFAGETYYSLPLNGGYSFFKILHEGERFAVLQKPANLPLLEFFVQQSKGTLMICEDQQEPGKKVLCEASIGPSFGMPSYAGGSVTYEVEDALFVAIEGQVQLVSCKYDTKGAAVAGETNIKRSNKWVLRRLKDVVKNEQKMQALRKQVAASGYNLEEPRQLIKALGAIYN